MGNLGMGVMLHHLFGDHDSSGALKACINKTIERVAVGDAVVLTFTDGAELKISDEGQSCCEHRYLTCDDDMKHYVGATFTGAECRDTGQLEDDWDVHETMVLLVHTSVGDITVTTHNKHNGYYGGFAMVCSVKGVEVRDR